MSLHCHPCWGSLSSPAWPTCSQSDLPALGLAVFFQREASSPFQRCCPRLPVAWITGAGCLCGNKGLSEEHEAFWPLGWLTMILNKNNMHRSTKAGWEAFCLQMEGKEENRSLKRKGTETLVRVNESEVDRNSIYLAVVLLFNVI